MNNAKKQKWENQSSRQENLKYQRNISSKDEHNKDRKQYRPNRSRRDQEKMVRIPRKTVQKDLNDPDNHDGVVTCPEQINQIAFLVLRPSDKSIAHLCAGKGAYICQTALYDCM